MARYADGDRGPAEDDVIAKLPDRTQITPAEAVTIATLAAKKMPIEDICEAVDRSPYLVKKAIAQGRELLGVLVPEAVTAWRKAMHVAAGRGFHQPAMHLMQAVKAIEPPQAAMPSNVVQVQVGFALPGLPQPQAHSLPVIDVKE